jgi:hypothetical protein
MAPAKVTNKRSSKSASRGRGTRKAKSSRTQPPRKPRPTLRQRHERLVLVVRRGYFANLKQQALASTAPTAEEAATTPSSNDALEFEIFWTDPGPAGLAHLIYNGVIVTETPSYGPGRVAVTFTRPQEYSHEFDWTLLFPGQTLHGLEAKAVVNNGVPKLLKGLQTKDTRWSDRAVC